MARGVVVRLGCNPECSYATSCSKRLTAEEAVTLDTNAGRMGAPLHVTERIGYITGVLMGYHAKQQGPYSAFAQADDCPGIQEGTCANNETVGQLLTDMVAFGVLDNTQATIEE